MPKSLKTLIYVVLGLITVLVLAIASVMLLINPNDYKPTLQDQARKKAGVHLQLNGELSWSIWPLGLQIADVVLNDRSDQPFAKLGLMTAQVDLLSLFTMKPVVNHILIEQLDLALVKNKNGRGNWQNLIDDKPKAQTEAGKTEAEPATEQAPLELLTESVQIKDAALRYQDQQNGQDLTLKPFNLQLSDIRPDHDFPAQLDFVVNLKEPALTLTLEFDTNARFSGDFKQIALKDAVLQSNVVSALFNNKAVNSKLALDLTVDLNQQTINLPKYTLSINQMNASGQAAISALDSTPQINADLNIAEFSLAELLTSLGIALPVMQDKAALGKFALSTQINGDTNEVALNQLTVKLDDTILTGSGLHRLADQFSKVKLAGDTIDLNRYLPPEPEKADPAPDQKTADTAQKAPIKLDLPDEPIDVAPLRSLNLDADISFANLHFKQIAASKVHLKLLAQKGLITVQDLSTQLLGGDLALNGTVDARGDALKVALNQKASNIAADLDLGEFIHQFSLHGLTNLTTTLNTQGKSIKSLADGLNLSSDFAMANGKILGGNASALTCEGIALVHGETISTRDWPQETTFEQLTTSIKMTGLNVTNTTMLQAAKLKLNGEGTIDLSRMYVDYGLTTYILGDLSPETGHTACRYNEKFANVGIPIRCKGELNGIKATFCLPDKERIGAMA
jgi:AsmA protein